MKKTRYKDKKLLDLLKNNVCQACGKLGPNDVHHLKSRGSGGDDHPSNLITLCRAHHSEIHQLGISKFILKFESVGLYLTLRGWEYDQVIGKWVCQLNIID